jgi:predicted dehydrogenase
VIEFVEEGIMKQVIQSYSSGELQLVETPVPQHVGRGDILVRTQCSLVSAGTEKAMIDVAKKSLLGKALARPDWVKRVIDKVKTDGLLEAWRQSQARLDTPMPLGYSSAGVVVDVGAGVTDFAVGDRVACSGSGYASHAEVTSVPRNLCVKIPPSPTAGAVPPLPILGEGSGVRAKSGVTFAEASFVALGGIALEAVRMARPEIGHRVAVIGLGLLGQLAVQLLKANGCQVLGIDLVEEKLDLARQLGADVAVNGGSDDVVAAARTFSEGYGVDSVIIMASTDSNQPLEQAAEICRERGRVVATGLVGLDIPRNPFYEKELDFVVSRAWGPGMYDPDYEERDVKYPLPYVRWTARRNMAAFLDLVAEGRVNLHPLITHRYPFDQALEAYGMILEGEEPYIGVVLEYDSIKDSELRTKKIGLRIKDSEVRAEDSEGKSLNSQFSILNSDVSDVGVGLIGAGLYARGTLLPALEKVKGVHRVGVATRSGLSGRHAGDKFGFDYCTTDYRELLADESVHAIFVLTRHGAHAHFVTEALRAGKAVFVEKPLALDEEELREVVRAALRAENSELRTKDSQFSILNSESSILNSQFLMVGLNRRFAPTTQFVQKRLANGAGPLVAHCRCNAGYIPPDVWVHDPEQGGGRIIGEVCHFVDLLHALTGGLTEEVHVAAAGGAQADLRDNITVSLKLDNGSVGSIVYAAGGDKSFPREYVEVFGGGAVSVIENFKSARVTQLGRTARTGRFSLSVDRGHVNELEAFVRHLREGGSPPVPLRDYVATTLATFAMEASITRGEAVKVDVEGFLRGCLEDVPGD